MNFSLQPAQTLVATTILVIVLYFGGLGFYRLYLSPLAKFPGPKLAALSGWYAGYHDLIRGGQYVFVVEEMHRKYGPIVRVRPGVLHVNDPEFIEVLYSQSPKQARERYWTVVQSLQAPGSVLATVDHDLHRKRRSVLNPFFSKQNVRRLEPIINHELSILFQRMDGWARIGQPVQINNAFRAATKDIIQAYAFGPSTSYLEMTDCNAAFFDVMTPQRVCHLGTYFYWLAVVMANMPPQIMTFLVPRIGVFADFMIDLASQIQRIQVEESPEGRTIFHEIIRSDIAASEKNTKRLTDEAMVILVAGSETTASTLAALFYHLLSDRYLLGRLKKELAAAMPAPDQMPDGSKLDNLPLLNAVIQEALRLYPGATHRQDRVAPNENLIYHDSNGKEYVIPAGVAVGMTAPLVNRHPDLYDRPNEFIPDRYIENPKLNKYLFSFSKGARQCVGINLAYQELQTFIAGVFRRYDLYDPDKKEQSGPTMELYKTTKADVSMYADYVTPGQYEGSQGLRLLIRN